MWMRKALAAKAAEGQHLSLKATTAAIVFLGFLSVEPVSAATYTLQSVMFEDGGIATGTFDFDNATLLYSNVSISTTSTATFPGTTFDLSDIFVQGIAQALILLRAGHIRPEPFTHALTFNFDPFLTSPVFTFIVTGREASSSLVRRITAGSISTVAPVPLPAALPLLGAGLAGFGAVGLVRRRRARAAE